MPPPAPGTAPHTKSKRHTVTMPHTGAKRSPQPAKMRQPRGKNPPQNAHRAHSGRSRRRGARARPRAGPIAGHYCEARGDFKQRYRTVIPEKTLRGWKL